jgi:hypothetical protein
VGLDVGLGVTDIVVAGVEVAVVAIVVVVMTLTVDVCCVTMGDGFTTYCCGTPSGFDSVGTNTVSTSSPASLRPTSSSTTRKTRLFGFPPSSLSGAGTVRIASPSWYSSPW